MDYIEKDKQQHQDKDGNGFWNFKHIVGHEGPFRTSNPEYKGSRYNVLVEWENGEITSEPLNIFGKDDPVTCAVYARKHGLLEEEGWKRFKGTAKREKEDALYGQPVSYQGDPQCTKVQVWLLYPSQLQ
jgi:hypothetical protein